VALRSLHEVFEADRRGLIKTISLEIGTNTTDPATGKYIYLPFVAVGAEREAFLEFDLAAVVPAATLSHLGAAVSRDPYNLAPADVTGIRRV
jgi:restriction system protein